MKLNAAVSQRLSELLAEKKMTQYQLFMKSGVPKSTIGNIVNCSSPSSGCNADMLTPMLRTGRSQ